MWCQNEHVLERWMLITNLRQQGVYGKEYTWYDFKAMDQMMDQGINMFRLNFRKPISHHYPHH
jgi:hypothetical protein